MCREFEIKIGRKQGDRSREKEENKIDVLGGVVRDGRHGIGRLVASARVSREVRGAEKRGKPVGRLRVECDEGRRGNWLDRLETCTKHTGPRR